MCPFHSSSFPESLALAKETGLSIGNMDEIQKLHIRSVPLGEQPRRLAHQDSSRTFAVALSQCLNLSGDSHLLRVPQVSMRVSSCSAHLEPAALYLQGRLDRSR